MSGKGFGSPIFGKRKPSAVPSITGDHPESKRSANAGSSLTPKITISRSRAESVASRSSTESSKPPPSPTFSANAALPPLAIKAVEDITTLSIQKIKAPSYLESKKLNTLHAAVHTGDLRKFKALVADKTRDINKLDSYHGFSALHLAVDENKYDFATLLIDPALALGEKEAKNKEAFVNSMLKVINLNTANREGRTPLIMAVIRGYSDIVHLLLKNHADINVQDIIGCTAIHYAIYLGDISSFKLLVDRGAKTDVIDKSGLPLHYHAIKCKRVQMSEILITGLSAEVLNIPYGADASTALHLAVENSMSSVIHALIDLGANPVALDNERRKPVERIDYTDYNQDIIDFLTLTEMSMFGSITSFVDTANSKVSKSVINLISKSAASLVASSNPQLVNHDLPTASSNRTIEDEIINPVKHSGDTSPMLSFSGDELTDGEEIDEFETEETPVQSVIYSSHNLEVNVSATRDELPHINDSKLQTVFETPTMEIQSSIPISSEPPLNQVKMLQTRIQELENIAAEYQIQLETSKKHNEGIEQNLKLAIQDNIATKELFGLEIQSTKCLLAQKSNFLDNAVSKIEELEKELLHQSAKLQSAESVVVSKGESNLDDILLLQAKVKECEETITAMEQAFHLQIKEKENMEDQIQTTSAQNKTLSQTITVLEEQLQHVLSQLKDKNHQFSVVEQEMRVLKSSTEVVKACHLESSKNELKDHLLACSAQMLMKESQITALENEIHELKKDYMQIKEHNIKLENSFAEEVKNSQLLEIKLQEAQLEHTNIFEELEAATSQVSDLNQKLIQSEMKNTSLELEYSSMQLEITSLKSQLDERDQSVCVLQTLVKKEQERSEKFHRLSLKSETELSALKTELAIHKGVINRRDNQVDSFRETLKELKAEQQVHKLAMQGADINKAIQETQNELNKDIAKYYEAEINILVHSVQEQQDIQRSQQMENMQLLSTLSSLEENIGLIEAKYQSQTKSLNSAEEGKTFAGTKIHDLESLLNAASINHQTALQKWQSEMNSVKTNLLSMTKSLEDTKTQLTATMKEKSELRKLWDELQADYKLKMLHHQQEVADLQRLAKQRLDSLSNEYESKLALLSTENSQLNVKLNDLESQKAEFIDNIEKAKNDVQVVEKKLSEMSIVYKELKAVLEVKDTEIAEKKCTLQESHVLKEVLETRIHNLELEKASVQNQLDVVTENLKISDKDKNNTIISLQLQLNTLLTDKDNLEESGQAIKKDLCDTTIQLNLCKTTLETKEQERKYQESLATMLQNNVTDLQLQMTESESELVELRHAYNAYQTKTQVEKERLESENCDLKLTVTNIENSCTEIQHQLANTERELENTKAELQSQSLALANAQESAQQLKMNLESQLEETKLELINVQASLQHQSTAFQQSEDASYLLKSQSQEAQLQLKHFQSPLSNDEPRSYHDDGDIHVGPLNLPDNLKVHHLFNEKEKENTLMKHEFEQLKKAFEEVQHQKMELEMDFNQEQLLKNKLLLKNNDLTKELQRVNATSEAATERLNTELNKFRVTLAEKEQGTLQLEEKLEVLQRISEKQSASIQAEKEEVIHSLKQKLEEIKQLREDLHRAQNIASKYNSLKGQLSCLTSSSQDMTSRDGHLVESTETLADESHSQSKQSYAKSPFECALSLPSNLNSQVQEVVMKLTTLEQVVATDASKLIGFMQNLSSNEFVEQEIKDIFKAVFGSQVQNQFETKSTLSLFRKALIDSLPTLEKQLTASIKVSDNNIEERLKILHAENLDLKKQLELSEEQYINIHQKLHIKLAEVKNLTLQNDELQIENDANAKDFKNKCKESIELKAAVESLETTIGNNSIKYNLLTQTNEKLKSEILKLEKDLQDVQEEHQFHVERISRKYQKDIELLEQDQYTRKHLELDLMEQKKKNLAIKEAQHYTDCEIARLEVIIKQLKSTSTPPNGTMDPTLSKVISDLQQVSEKLFQAQQKSNDFVCQADMSYLETSLKFISKEVSQLQTIIRQAASTDNPSRMLIQSLVDKVNQIESNLEHNTYGNNFLNDLRLENAKLRKKIDLVKVDHEEIEKNLSNSKTEIRDLQEQLKNTTAAKHRIETEFQNLQTEHKVLGGELNTLQNHIRFYEDERQIFKETAYYLQEQLHHSEKSHQTKDKRIHALEYSLNEQLEKYAESESKLGVQRKLNDRLTEQLSVVQSVQTASKQEPKLQTKISTSSEEINSFNGVKELQQQVTKMEAKLAKLNLTYNANLSYICRTLEEHAIDRKLIGLVQSKICSKDKKRNIFKQELQTMIETISKTL